MQKFLLLSSFATLAFAHSNVTADGALESPEDDLSGTMDAMWMIICGALVMYMQAGFAMLTAGCAREKNVQSILLKNMIDICVATIAYWSVGYAIAFKPNGSEDGTNGFIGAESGFFLEDAVAYNSTAQAYDLSNADELYFFFFQWAFTATTATIVSGCVMERVNFWAYAMYVFVLTAFIYPVVVHTTWGYGWLSFAVSGAGIDFAGSGIVHLTGGVAGLVGAIVLGPRIGRFNDGYDQSDFEPHNMALMTLGTIILWMGFYGFNCGSTLAFSSHDTAKQAGLVAVNSTIAAATGGLTAFLMATLCHGYGDYGIFGLMAHIGRKLMCQKSEKATAKFPELKMDLCELCNGVLAGLVSITAGCGNLLPSAAFFAGLIGAMVYLMSSSLLKIMKVDDPINAFPVHGACGMWGVWAAALFDMGPGMSTHHGWNGFSTLGNGTNTGDALLANTLEILFIWGWVGGLSFICFFTLHKLGLLRLDEKSEIEGLDAHHHVQKIGYRQSAEISPEQMAEITSA